MLAAVATAPACGSRDQAPPAAHRDSLTAPGESLYARGAIDSARLAWGDALTRPGVAGSASEARLLTWLGLAAWRLGDYADARRLGERALEQKQRLGLTADVPQSLNALGLLAWNEGRFAEAADLFRAAGAGFGSIGDQAGVAKASNNLGLVLLELGRYDAARTAFTTALDTARAIGDALIEGRALANAGMLEIWTGDPGAAPPMLRRARTILDAADDPVGAENALGQLGVAYAALGEPGLALAALDSALALARRVGLREEEANDLAAIAEIYRDAGDPDRAMSVFAEARGINEDLGLPVEAGIALRNEAMIRAARGAVEPARRDVMSALQLHRQAEARLEEFNDLLVLADVEFRAGRPGAAERALDEGRQLAARLGSAQARVSFAVAEAGFADANGNPRRALAVLALARADLPRGGPAAEAEAHALRLRAFAALGQLDSAVAAGGQAVAAIERVRDGFASGLLRTSYVADRSRVYADLVVALLALDRTDDAFAVADAARGRALLEHLTAVRRDAGRAVGVRDLEGAERLLRRIDRLLAALAEREAVPPRERGPDERAVSEELARHLEKARGDYEALLVRAEERDPARARLLGARATRGADVRDALGPDEAVLEYLVTADRVFAFAATRQGIRVTSHPISREELTHRVQLARELLTTPEANGRDHAVAEALYEMLVAPAVSGGWLAAARRLFIVPHGALTYLPFAALRDSATGRILAEHAAIAYLPSAATLPLLRQGKPVDPMGARGVAFAPFPDRLPSTEAEARAFRRAVPGAAARLGRRASEAALRSALSQGRLVHVATHGVMNARNPMFSRVELARGRDDPADDGRLEVHELLDLRIASPLVFLSGCQTGLGSAWATAFDQGEDYATLAQAFLHAGAGSVVATLWRIDDAGAAAFAERFYHHLRTRSAPEALAAAQLDLRADSRWRSPYYWAAYTFSGTGFQPPAQTGAAMAVQYR